MAYPSAMAPASSLGRSALTAARRNPLIRFRRPAAVLLAVLASGTLGYVLIERWSPLDAFFMTLITISTVGYGEVHPLGPAGKVFTSALILGGVGTMLWVLGIFTDILGTGQLGEYRRERALAGMRRQLRDHFIICGYGRMGTRIVQELEREAVPFVVIDNNPEAVSRLGREDKFHLEGDAAHEETLREAGIDRARALLCAVDSDERAVYIVLAARSLREDLYILSRAGQPESIRRLELAGANRVISPYRMAGHQMAALALRPALVDVMDTLHHGDADIGLEEIVVPAGSQLIGHSLENAQLNAEGGSNVLAVRRRGGEMHVGPDPHLVVEEGDLIVALGSDEQLRATAARLTPR
ncbi:MAG: potassium channel protein [Candidatus Dormibacteraeota bacterium]|uniref:Potassium channel protein n=1 Tax=Candidatus Dormiibacter inghamiae TaxID=3127013 RepID=A0A934NEE2_9BACT|nr:potassium channel protein [Candidatus Dormibacteraeota bacterium]MBJ7606314.1 potassium channel protein [Candidatus Dormibacteraeota bacterium]